MWLFGPPSSARLSITPACGRWELAMTGGGNNKWCFRQREDALTNVPLGTSARRFPMIRILLTALLLLGLAGKMAAAELSLEEKAACSVDDIELKL